MSVPAAVTALAVLALLAAEWSRSRRGVWIAKPLASTGFVAAGLTAGGLTGVRTGDVYAIGIVAGLVLSWWGDVLLVPRERPGVFRAGILAFLLGHVAYAAAFFGSGVSPAGAAIAAAVLAGPVLLVVRWLGPHVPPDLAPAVYAYVVVITAMLVGAAGTTAAGRDPAILLGAGLFYVSDLAVARDRFVAPGFANAAWGLPFYYGAQLVLAGTLAGG